MIKRYPDGTALTVAALATCGWRDLVLAASAEGYSRMWSALSDAAKSATDSGEFEKARVLWLLADVCSMMLKPESATEPFKPLMEFPGGRTAIPDDLPQDALQFLETTLGRFDVPLVRARILDILWLRLRRTHEHATGAIDAYTMVPVNRDSWHRDGLECWLRGIQLCRQLGKGSGDRLTSIRDQLLGALQKTSNEDAYLGMRIASALRQTQQHEQYASVVGERLAALARESASAGDAFRATDYFMEAATWYDMDDNAQLAAESRIAAAELRVGLAYACHTANQRKNAEAASHLETAIQTYRMVPRDFRASLGVDKKLVEAHPRMREYGALAVEEMGSVTSGPVDITDVVLQARDAVRAKSMFDALRALASLDRGANVQRDRQFAQKMVHEHPLQSLFAAKVMASDGRVVAKVAALSLSPGLPSTEDPSVWAQMVRHHLMRVGLAVQGSILPALEVIRVEHRIREHDFVMLVRRAGIIPLGRHGLIGKALFLGHEGEWAACAHLLVPQMEHMVRAHLKQAGERTTVLDARGIEQEVGMSALMDNPKVDVVLGPNIAYEFRALLCDPIGTNLRNDIAHGLVGDEIDNSAAACYVWWLMMRLVVMAFWNAERSAEADHANGGKPSDGDAGTEQG